MDSTPTKAEFEYIKHFVKLLLTRKTDKMTRERT